MKGHNPAGKKKSIFSTTCVAIVLVVCFLLAFPWIFAMSRNNTQQPTTVAKANLNNIDPLVIAELTSQIAAKLNLKRVRYYAFITMISSLQN
jgi:hypothetical protein